MSAGLAERVIGVQTPRVEWFPEGDWDWSLGDQCVTWSRETLGVHLDRWEQRELRRMLARRPDGRWVCAEYGMLLSRRNGKSHVLVIRFLFGLLVLGDEAAEYTAHHGKTVRATFRLALKILGKAPGKLPGFKPYTSAGRESIQFDSGQEFAFSTRTKSAGRGTGADTLAVDEAQEADDDEMDAIAPTLGDRSISGNPQLIYAGSSGNYLSVVFGRVRRRALARNDPRLGWDEWSIDDEAYREADTFERERMVTAVESIAQANPALGIVREDGSGGLSLEWLQGQLSVLSAAGFAREHLGVGTWPKDDGTDWVIPRLAWQARAATDSALPTGALVLAVSASAWGGERTFSIGAAGGVAGGCHGWLERMDRGSTWVVPDLKRLAGDNSVAAVVIDDRGPASSLTDDIENALKPLGVPLHRFTSTDAAQACGSLSDAVTDDPPSFTHRGQPEVDAALAGAKAKKLAAGLWAFDREASETDIDPLEALAYARAGWVLYAADVDVLQTIW